MKKSDASIAMMKGWILVAVQESTRALQRAKKRSKWRGKVKKTAMAISWSTFRERCDLQGMCIEFRESNGEWFRGKINEVQWVGIRLFIDATFSEYRKHRAKKWAKLSTPINRRSIYVDSDDPIGKGVEVISRRSFRWVTLNGRQFKVAPSFTRLEEFPKWLTSCQMHSRIIKAVEMQRIKDSEDYQSSLIEFEKKSRKSMKRDTRKAKGEKR